MLQFITPEEARAIVLEQVVPLPTETIPHAAALDRVLAREIISPVALPPFDNSAMDGYALCADDLQNASESAPARLRVIETIAAGNAPQQFIERGTCAKIMTGAQLPKGADAVVMREETDDGADDVKIFQKARHGQNIRRAGEEIARGEIALEAGTSIRPAQWGWLASLEQNEIETIRRPRVALIVTGEELVELGSTLQAGQIRDSNSYALTGLALASGAQIVEKRRVGDDVQAMKETLRECAANCDAIITSGGVSAGDFDPVRDALHELAAQDLADSHCWKIKTKPGAPVLFATLPSQEYCSTQEYCRTKQYSVPVFGLPGNPVSVMVSWEQYVRPALLKMGGRTNLRRVELPVVVDEAKSSPLGKVEFARVFVRRENDAWRASGTGAAGSGRLSSMARANALLVIPAETTQVEAGSTLLAQMTQWPEIE